jgi:serine/threonine protein kinase
LRDRYRVIKLLSQGKFGATFLAQDLRDLSNAQITKEQLAQAKTNWATVLPSGKQVFW